MEIEKVEICAASQTFENGVISWRLCSQNQCALLTGEDSRKLFLSRKLKLTRHFINSPIMAFMK